MKKLFKLCILFMLVLLIGCTNKIISEDEAKQIALKDAQVKENEITFLEKEIDDDEYKFVFQNKTTKYEYEINKKNGRIEQKKEEIIKSETSNNTEIQPTLQIISEDEAKQIALKDAQVKENEITFLEKEIDDDEYKFVFQNKTTKYEYKINRKDGRIEHRKDEIIKSETSNNTEIQPTLQIISLDEAKQIAYEELNVSEMDVQNLEVELKNKNNIPHYDIEFEVGIKEYSIKINAQTKEIIEKEIDY